MNRNRNQAHKEITQAHRDNIQRALQHRIEVARANGDDRLIRLLEAEANYFN